MRVPWIDDGSPLSSICTAACSSILGRSTEGGGGRGAGACASRPTGLRAGPSGTPAPRADGVPRPKKRPASSTPAGRRIDLSLRFIREELLPTFGVAHQHGGRLEALAVFVRQFLQAIDDRLGADQVDV